jgi:hypothetical protein
MTTTTTPDWNEIAAPGAELGAEHRAELVSLLAELKLIAGTSSRSGATLLHHLGGEARINDAHPDLVSACKDAAFASVHSRKLVASLERKLAGLA